jgi:sulfur carrier protein
MASISEILRKKMNIELNNSPIKCDEGLTVTELLVLKQRANVDGLAIAINNVVIPKSTWATTKLNENDKLIFIAATAGG